MKKIIFLLLACSVSAFSADRYVPRIPMLDNAGSGITAGQNYDISVTTAANLSSTGTFKITTSDGLVITSPTITNCGGTALMLNSTDYTTAGLVGLCDRFEVPFPFTLTEVRMVFTGAPPFQAMLSTGTITFSTATAASYAASGTNAFVSSSTFSFNNVYSTQCYSLAGAIGNVFQKGDMIRACATTVQGAVNIAITLVGNKQ